MGLKYLLVWPSTNCFGFKPIGLGLIAALLKRAGHELEFFDSTYIELGNADRFKINDEVKLYKPVDFKGYNVKKQKLDVETEFTSKLKSFKPDIIGFSTLSDEVDLSNALSGYAKKWNPHVTIIWGNKAPTMIPEQILANPDVDYICRGEGFELAVEFADAIAKGDDPRDLKNLGFRDKNGQPVLNPLRPYFQDADGLPYLDLGIFDERHFLKPFNGKLYRGAEHMLYWGCPFKCTYCLVDSMRELYGKGMGRYIRGYSIPRIVEELKALTQKHDVTMWKFFDEEFAVKPVPMFTELAKSYAAEVNRPFCCTANAWNLTKEKVELLRYMGCTNITMGYESGNEDLRTMVLKRKEKTDEIAEATRWVKDAGIRTSAYNMIALPYESRQTLFQTVELNKKAGVQDPSVNFWYPLEGTELRKIAIAEGLYDPEHCEPFDLDRPHIPVKGMTTEQLIAFKKRFHIYVKLPYEFFKYIQRSERDDTLGKALYIKLRDIYEAHVLNHGGLWNPAAPLQSCLDELETLVGDEEIEEFDFEILKQSKVEKAAAVGEPAKAASV